MMKSWLITVVILLGLVGAYYLNLFQWLASQGALITALILMAVVLTAAFIILGNPFRRADDHDDIQQ